jgi:hypothetical protein
MSQAFLYHPKLVGDEADSMHDFLYNCSPHAHP